MTNILEFIDPFIKQYKDKIYLSFSGGKDSTVLLEEICKIYPDILILHNPKKDTNKDTIEFIYNLSCKYFIQNVPFNKMQEFINKNNLQCQIDGTRISEFDRTEKSSDITIDGKLQSRLNMNSEIDHGLWGIKNIYPIYDWKDEDVFDYIIRNNIKLSKEYDNDLMNFIVKQERY